MSKAILIIALLLLSTPVAMADVSVSKGNIYVVMQSCSAVPKINIYGVFKNAMNALWPISVAHAQWWPYFIIPRSGGGSPSPPSTVPTCQPL